MKVKKEQKILTSSTLVHIHQDVDLKIRQFLGVTINVKTSLLFLISLTAKRLNTIVLTSILGHFNCMLFSTTK